MKRLIIICEGSTEVQFCRILLEAHFFNHNIQIHPAQLKKSGGGIVAWGSVKKQIEIHLKQDQEAVVTTFVDYYGIKPKHFFPAWNLCMQIPDKIKRIDALERAMQDEIDDSLRYRFIPYIQLHEFEGLLFNSAAVFERNIPSENFSDREQLGRIIEEYPNPELINDTLTNSPSHRLQRIIQGYNKAIDGPILASEIGLVDIRAKSPRFNKWIETLEALK
jgi:hypothetical protein